MTTVIDSLEQGGLVPRERSADGRRIIQVHLGPDGERLRQRALGHRCRKLGVVS